MTITPNILTKHSLIDWESQISRSRCKIFGQLAGLLRSRYCDAKIRGINKTDGLTWRVIDILDRAKANVAAGMKKL